MCLGVLLTVALGQGADGRRAVAAGESKLAPVLSGCEIDYPPYCIVTGGKQADGFSVELLRAALRAVGRDVAFKTGPWPRIQQDLIDGRVQALPLVARTPAREALFDFSFSYLTMHGTVVVREDNAAIHGPADLKGKRVAVLQGDYAYEYVQSAKLGAVIVPRSSFETALRELSAGKHDAVVIQRLLAFRLIQKAGIKNLRSVGPPLQGYSQSFCFAVRKGHSALLAELNEGLAIAMADGTFRRLYAKWFSAIEAAGRSKSRIVVGGDRHYPPYEFLDRNGRPTGYNADLTRAIARHGGLAVDIQLGAWSKIRKGLESGDIDLAEGMFYSPERDNEFAFSPPHALVHHVIVVRKGSPEPSDMKELAGKAILVMAGDVMEDLAMKHGYGKHVVAVPSQEEALRLLAAGKQDCALVAELPALHWIEKNGWRNLRISGSPVLSAEYCYAVPHGKEDLLLRFTEGLAALKETGEYRKLQVKWLSPYEAPRTDWRTVAKYVLAAMLPILALLIASALWSRSLQRQVASRTRDVVASEERFRQIAETAGDWIWEVDATGLYTYASPAAERILGYTPEEIVGKKHFYDLLAPEVRDALREAAFEAFARKETLRGVNANVHKDGHGVVLETNGVPVLDAKGVLVGYRGADTDITERSRIEVLERERSATHETILRLGKSITQVADLRSCLLGIHQAVREGLGFDRAGIFLHDVQRGLLRGTLGTSRTGALEEGWDVAFPVGAMQFVLDTPSGIFYTADHQAEFAPGPGSGMEGVKENAAASMWSGGTPVGVLCVDNLLTGRPITEENLEALRLFAGYAGVAIENARLLAQVQESEERYRALFDRSLDCVYVHDFGGRFIDANDAALHLLGYGREEIQDLTFQSLLSPDQLPKAYEVIEELKATGSQRGISQFRLRCKSGESVDVESKASVIFREGKPVHVQGIARDITERKRAEEALLSSQRKYQSMVENIGIGVALISPRMEVLETNRQMRLWSPAVTPGEGNLCYAHFNTPPRLEPCSYCPTTKTLQDGQVHEAITATPTDGGIRRYRVVSSPICDSEGRVTAAIEMVEDVTDRIEMEARLAQQQRLASIVTLARGAAHEINNPINGAMNYAQLILDATEEGSPLHEYAGEIVRESERVATIVRNLLQFSRQEGEAPSLARVQEIVEQTLALVGAEMRKDQIALHVEAPEDLPSVRCRTQQIRQVLMNLLTNARDALNARYPEPDDNKIIRVIARPFDRDGASWVRVTVEDHGSGIAEEVQGRVFDPFFTTKPRNEGAGLGLFISYGFAKEHRGELHFETEPGQWTRFHLDLPVDGGGAVEQEESQNGKSTGC